MFNNFPVSYLKEAVKAHLDLEEDELELLHINQRFHIFANEAIQQICYTKPKYKYFEFTVVKAFDKLVYDDGVLRKATNDELNGSTTNEPNYADDDEIVEWYNNQNIYLVGQTISLPDDAINFAEKAGYLYNDYITNKIIITSKHIMFLSQNEFITYYPGNYLVPYVAIWTKISQDTEDSTVIDMPSDLLLTIPIYVASIFLQQRNLTLAQSKRQEFEIAVSRCKATSYLTNKTIKRF